MLEKKKCVLVAEEQGNIVEVETSLKELYRYLKGTSTIIGSIPQLDAVILKCNESPFDLLVNRNTYVLPLEERYVLGPILIVRMDENSDHQDLTLSEVEPTLHLQV
tara:strand:- start:26491 stop:26808 length:318 start_codon:yes stop_codon:yes gene_type:complete